jgi:hypothetical protein
MSIARCPYCGRLDDKIEVLGYCGRCGRDASASALERGTECGPSQAARTSGRRTVKAAGLLLLFVALLNVAAGLYPLLAAWATPAIPSGGVPAAYVQQLQSLRVQLALGGLSLRVAVALFFVALAVWAFFRPLPPTLVGLAFYLPVSALCIADAFRHGLLWEFVWELVLLGCLAAVLRAAILARGVRPG